MAWLINEARALKTKFDGLTITDVESGTTREIDTWFRTPESEIRTMTYPSVVLEYSGVGKADDREHRAGRTTLGYIPEQYGPGPVDGFDTSQPFDPNDSPFRTWDYPIPYNVDFTVTVYARFQSQLLPIVAQLAQIDRIPPRFGYLEVPQDGTVRTLELQAGPEIVNSSDAEGKRLLQAVYGVRTVSELSLYDVTEITNRINSVNIDMKVLTSVS